MQIERIRGLLVDIDDTITRLKPAKPGEPPIRGSLFDVLKSAAVEMAGWTPEEAATVIARVEKEIPWWHWSDFIVALRLKPKDFWEYAYIKESRYLEATGPDLRPALERLDRAGILLYVTSNNPCSGILHKLRIAGLGDFHRCALFSRFLGPPELHASKPETSFWQKALAHIGLNGDEAAVVGDSLRDDYQVPHSVGIAGTFLINRAEDLSAQDTDSLIHVTSFTQIADLVLGARPGGRHQG
jgi:FMN phosphatase YigB (HAD superfamily)